MSSLVHHTRPTRRLRRAWGAVPLAAAVVALGLTGQAAAAPAPSGGVVSAPITAPAPGAQAQGIIMRDGGVCDPIRHMGC